MSYLRGCGYAADLGWDTGRWLAAIRALQPRLDAHRLTRGVDQRLAFADLYERLGLPGAEARAALWVQTGIARRQPVAQWLARPPDAYDFTHEVFEATGRGRRQLPVRHQEELDHARRAALALLEVHRRADQVDTAAELLIAARLLGLPPDHRAIAEARRWLLAGQAPEGRFGRYGQGEPDARLAVGAYLHTTWVAIWALALSCA
jgi:hypothetical protein